MGRQVVGGLKRPWSIIIWFVWDENPNWQVGLRSSSTKQTIDNLKISSGWWFGAVFFPIYWEFHHPNWLSLHHFSEG
jgi:hypothetical protein